MISKTTGEIKELDETLSNEITFTVNSMNRKFMTTSIIAFFTTYT